MIGLGVKDFIVREDQVAREISRVSADHDPMQIALLVDDSRAIREREAVYRKAVATFIEGMRSEVTIALITTGNRPTVRVDYTRDRQKLLDAVGRLFGDGRNETFDAIFESSVGLAKRPIMRPVIVAISTGTGNGGYRQRLKVLDALQWSQAALHVVTVSAKGGRPAASWAKLLRKRADGTI